MMKTSEKVTRRVTLKWRIDIKMEQNKAVCEKMIFYLKKPMSVIMYEI